MTFSKYPTIIAAAGATLAAFSTTPKANAEAFQIGKPLFDTVVVNTTATDPGFKITNYRDSKPGTVIGDVWNQTKNVTSPKGIPTLVLDNQGILLGIIGPGDTGALPFAAGIATEARMNLVKQDLKQQVAALDQ